MGKGPSNGGVVASRGFIFQTIVAEIQCLERDDWDTIKVEPETENDKVDIMLYKDGKKISAIQVKSSVNPFSDTKVKDWLEKLRADAGDAAEICLYLVGDSFTSSCEDFISKNKNEIEKVSFKNIQNICIDTLIKYIRSKGADWDVRMDEYEFISDALFSKLFKNSISQEPVSCAAFEERFQRALPVHIIPKCLTSVPAVNHTVGLVGRSKIRKTVRDMLEDNGSMALVNGLGGIGKTAVMQYVCNDLRDEGKYVAWVECGGSLKEDLLLLRTALGIPESDNVDTAYAKIISELKANRQLAGNLYLFLDNLSRKLSDDEQETLYGLNIHVMATSRFEHEYFINLSLDVLEEASALGMFYGYYLERQTDKTHRYVEAAKEIIGSVQSHTLLVELFAKAAAKKGGTLEDFRDDLKAQGVFDIFKRKLNTRHDRNRTIEECVMELYKIADLTPSQQHIMKLFTIFTPEKEIYYKIGEWAALDMDAMDELVELGWLEQGGLENGYHIHQIIRDSIARQMKKNGEKVRLEDYNGFLGKVIDANGYLGKKVPYEKIRERIVLLEDIARFFDECGRKDIVGSKIYNSMAGAYQDQGRYEKGLKYYKRALDIHEMLRKDHPSTAALYNDIASVYHAMGKYDKAMEYYNRAMAIREEVLGQDHPSTANTYGNIASVYRDMGKYEKALEYFKKALAIKLQVLGENHPSTAQTYNNMARVYEELGLYDKALKYYKKALAINEKMLGKDHSDTAITYNNMAAVFSAKGEYDEALKYYEKALEIKEKMLGKDHPDIATTYNNMAIVYQDNGNYPKAMEYYEKALDIQEKVLGKNHPSTAITYGNIAGVYQEQKNYDKALEYYEEALSIKENVLEKNHSSIAITYGNIAGVHYAQGNYDKVLEYSNAALAIQEKVLGNNHPATAFNYGNMAAAYLAQGDYDNALKYSEKALDIQEEKLGKDHPDTARTYNNMGHIYLAQDRYEKALEYFRKAHDAFLLFFGESHPHTQDTERSILSLEILLMLQSK